MSDDPIVLVTGVTGYLGAHVMKQAQEAGYRVRGTVRNKDPKKTDFLFNIVPNAKHKLELFEADLLNDESWIEPAKGCTYICHVASPFPDANPKEESILVKPAVEGTLSVLKAAQLAKTVKRVVVTSSTAAVAERGGNAVPYDESKWADPKDPLVPFYNRSKIYAERAAWDFVRELPDEDKFELAVINPTGIIGPPLNATAGTSIGILTRLLEHQMPMVPRLSIPMVDVRDVARAHIIAMTLPEAAGHRHITNTKCMWYAEVAKVIADEFSSQGYNIPTRQMPGFLLTVAGWFDKTIKMAKEFAKSPIALDNTRFTKVLGIQPVDMNKSILDSCYGAIESGFTKKTDKYKGAPDDYLSYTPSGNL